MSLNKVYVHVDDKRNKPGQFYTGISRTTSPDGLLLSTFDAKLFDRIRDSSAMKRMRAEMTQLSKYDVNTRMWAASLGIANMFQYYFDPRRYDKKRPNVIAHSSTSVGTNPVTDAMDISNFASDNLASEIADHTFAQAVPGASARTRQTHVHSRLKRFLAQHHLS